MIGSDSNWRCEWTQTNLPKLETIRYDQLGKGNTVLKKLREMVDGDVDVAIEASGAEYGKSTMKKTELATELQLDTADISNACAESTGKFGRVGIIADYAGCKLISQCILYPNQNKSVTIAYTNYFKFGSVMERGIKLIGNGHSQFKTSWKVILPWVETGQVDPTIMLTHQFTIDDIAKSYKVLLERPQKLEKCFATTRFSHPRAQETPQLTRL